MSRDKGNMLKELFDVLHLIWYNKHTNVSLRGNVFHHPQLQPGETLRNRGKLRHSAVGQRPRPIEGGLRLPQVQNIPERRASLLFDSAASRSSKSGMVRQALFESHSLFRKENSSKDHICLLVERMKGKKAKQMRSFGMVVGIDLHDQCSPLRLALLTMGASLWPFQVS
jgi:hypothetical protein